MKKRLAIILTSLVALSFVACSTESHNEATTQNNIQHTDSVQNSTDSATNSLNENTTSAPATEKKELTIEDVNNHSVTSESDIECRTSSDGYSLLSRYNGTDEIFIMPDTFDSLPIVAVNTYALANNNNCARAIKFGNNVETICELSCSVNETLEIVITGTNTKTIEKGAFQSCSELKEVVLNEGLEKICTLAFSSCSSLTSITIPDPNTEIEGNAFFWCHKDLTIYGKAGSTAEVYATENNIKFVAQ